ncbi:MAG: DUF2182 domain-containing protein [Paracoccaceae bacterium]
MTQTMRAAGWIAVFAAILAAWAWLWMMAVMAGIDPLGRPVAPMAMEMDGFGVLVGMWAVMMAAMMLPTLVPSLRTYDDLIPRAGTRAGWWGFLGGYFVVWIGMALTLAAAQWAMMRLGWVDRLGRAGSLGQAGLLIAAGLWQLSAVKATCQGVCLSPMSYFLGRWRPGAGGGLRMGVGFGTYCAACCWAFMALGFVGGTMNLAWMGLATLAMVLEKLPAVGMRLTRPLGAALILAGLALAIWNL